LHQKIPGSFEPGICYIRD